MEKLKFFSILLFIFHASLHALTWDDVARKDKIYLYAGDVPKNPNYGRYVGLSLTQNNHNHVLQDVTHFIPLPDDSVEIYQSEDVFEHIEYDQLIFVINEAYRILKPNGLLRISVPDYRCDVLYARSIKDDQGNLLFDPGGGGYYQDGKVLGGGHVWFPTIEQVKSLCEATAFGRNGRIEYLHYYDSNGVSITHRIDYRKGYIKRTPDHDDRVKNPYRVMSIVVDLYK
jgi:SAM-dependent methyltransferase